MSNTPISFMTLRPNRDVQGVMDIDPQETWNRRADAQIVDVRQPEEYSGELGHISGAKLIVLDTLPEGLETLEKTRPVIFVCRSGGRSAQAAYFAAQVGFTQAYNMAGGMLRWKQDRPDQEGK